MFVQIMRLRVFYFWKNCSFKRQRVKNQILFEQGEYYFFDICLVDYWLQEDQYDYLDVVDMVKVEKSTSEVMEWMNNRLNLQNKQSLIVDLVVKVKEIEVKIKVIYSFKYLVVFLVIFVIY